MKISYKSVTVEKLRTQYDSYVDCYVSLKGLIPVSGTVEDENYWVLARQDAKYVYIVFVDYTSWTWRDGSITKMLKEISEMDIKGLAIEKQEDPTRGLLPCILVIDAEVG